MPTLRKLTKNDFDIAYEIYMDEQVNPYMSFEQMDKIAFKPLFERFFKRSEMLIYEHEQQKVVGVCRLTPFPGPGRHRLELGSLAIHRDFRGQGFGRKMMATVYDYILEHYPHVIRYELGAEADNPIAIKLYESLGFQREACLTQFLKRQTGIYIDDPPVDEILMVKYTRQVPTHEAPHRYSYLKIKSGIASSQLTLRQATAASSDVLLEFYQLPEICHYQQLAGMTQSEIKQLLSLILMIGTYFKITRTRYMPRPK